MYSSATGKVRARNAPWPRSNRLVGYRDPMQLDKALPRWDRRDRRDRQERHRVPCNASSAAVMRAAEEVTWQEAPIFLGLMTMMSLGRPRFSANEPILDVFTDAGSVVLARTEDELLVGGIERFSRSRPAVRLPRPGTAASRDFDRPGCVKIGLNFWPVRG